MVTLKRDECSSVWMIFLFCFFHNSLCVQAVKYFFEAMTPRPFKYCPTNAIWAEAMVSRRCLDGKGSRRPPGWIRCRETTAESGKEEQEAQWEVTSRQTQRIRVHCPPTTAAEDKYSQPLQTHKWIGTKSIVSTKCHKSDLLRVNEATYRAVARQLLEETDVNKSTEGIERIPGITIGD